MTKEYTVKKTAIGMWHSFDKDGNPLVTGLTSETCSRGTEFFLNNRHEFHKMETIKYDGTVGGKL